MVNNTVTMAVTESVIENITDFMTTVNSYEEDFGNALTAILWLIAAILLLLFLACASCFR
jgi:uncharacterized protein involved in cysteine biosynthesis